jgi:4-amino-4-deoxy-L-arabinose transferase-like glycosyltransferase
MLAALFKARNNRWVYFSLVIVIFLLAVFLRTYRLDSVPPGLFHDEAVNGLDVLTILGGEHPLFFEANNGREPLFIYIQALSVALLGQTAVALRLVAAIFGLLTIVATFLTARAWFGDRVAIVAMAGISFAFWQVDLSRVGFRAISTPFFLTVALFFLWKSFRGDSWWHPVAGAVCPRRRLYKFTQCLINIYAPPSRRAVGGWGGGGV